MQHVDHDSPSIGSDVSACTLQALAKQHPQRLYFPFTLSRQHWGATGEKRGAALEALLRNPLIEAFANALNDTTYPGQRMESWLGLLRPLVSANDRVRSEGPRRGRLSSQHRRLACDAMSSLPAGQLEVSSVVTSACIVTERRM